jgi:hypothetical protein
VLLELTLLTMALLASCVAIQSVGTVILIRWLDRHSRAVEAPTPRRGIDLLVRLFMQIVLLHLLQISLWALAYWAGGQLPSIESATYFSIVTYTTVGFGDLVLGPPWRMMAGIESLTGIILLGWSTAFVFAVLNEMYAHWRQRELPPRTRPDGGTRAGRA